MHLDDIKSAITSHPVLKYLNVQPCAGDQIRFTTMAFPAVKASSTSTDIVLEEFRVPIPFTDRHLQIKACVNGIVVAVDTLIMGYVGPSCGSPISHADVWHAISTMPSRYRDTTTDLLLLHPESQSNEVVDSSPIVNGMHFGYRFLNLPSNGSGPEIVTPVDNLKIVIKDGQIPEINNGSGTKVATIKVGLGFMIPEAVIRITPSCSERNL